MAPSLMTTMHHGFSLHPVFAERAVLKTRNTAHLRSDSNCNRTTTSLGSAHYVDDDLFHSSTHKTMTSIQSRTLQPSFDLQRELYGSHIKLGADAAMWSATTRDSFPPPDSKTTRASPPRMPSHSSSVHLGVGASRSFDTTTSSSFRNVSGNRPAVAQSRLATTSSSVAMQSNCQCVWESSTKTTFNGMVRGGHAPPPSNNAKKFFLGDHIRIGDGTASAWVTVNETEFGEKSIPEAELTALAGPNAEIRRSHVVLGDDSTNESVVSSAALEFRQPHPTAKPSAGRKSYQSSVRIQMGGKEGAWRTKYSDDYQDRSTGTEARANRELVRDNMTNRSGISLGQDARTWLTTSHNAFQKLDVAEAHHGAESAARRAMLLEHHVRIGDGSRHLPYPTSTDSYTPDVHRLSDRRANHQIGAAMKKSLSTSSVKLGSEQGQSWQRSVMLNPVLVGRTEPIHAESQRSHWAIGTGRGQYNTTNLASHHYQRFQ